VGSGDVTWSLGKSPDLLVEVWSTAALLEAVIGALLEEPENLRLAMAALAGRKAL
jgi:hypothetical protein